MGLYFISMSKTNHLELVFVVFHSYILVLVHSKLGFVIDWNLATLDICHLFIIGLLHLWSWDIHLHVPRMSVELEVPVHI